jgi:hypothetical protein
MGGAIASAMANAGVILLAANLSASLSAFVPAHKAEALARGKGLFDLEQHVHIAWEPQVQQSVLYGLHTSLGSLSGFELREATVWVYTHAYPTWLIAGLAWSYLFRRAWFSLLRDIMVISGFLAVTCYRLLPTAPPRFILSGAPYYLQDWTHSGVAASVKLATAAGFNAFASFPSVHMLWSLIPAVCVARGSRSVFVWAAALLFPLVMFITVLATGNHYVIDAMGSLAVLAVSYVLARIADLLRQPLLKRMRVVPPHFYVGRDLPAALGLAMACAGTLAFASTGFNVRALVALAILIAVLLAVIQNSKRAGPRTSSPVLPRKAEFYHYMAGILFVAGASAALRGPGMDTRICSLLWLIAALSALTAHATDRRKIFPRGWRMPATGNRRYSL